MHEPPEVPNYGKPGHGPRLLRGMTMAVEPMVNAGSAAIVQMCRRLDGENRRRQMSAAHYENTILHHRRRAGASDGPSESLV